MLYSGYTEKADGFNEICCFCVMKQKFLIKKKMGFQFNLIYFKT